MAAKLVPSQTTDPPLLPPRPYPLPPTRPQSRQLSGQNIDDDLTSVYASLDDDPTARAARSTEDDLELEGLGELVELDEIGESVI